MNTGVRLGCQHFGSFAYADDVNLISATVPGLQRMIYVCGVCFLIQSGADLGGGLPAPPSPFRATMIREEGGGGLFPVDLSVQTANT